VYVLVTSANPLRLFIFKDGLARFCTVPYAAPTRENILDDCMHLTNYSVNRRSSDFKASSSASSDDGSKRSISSVFRMLRKERGVDIDKVWSDIEDVITKTMLMCQPVLATVYSSCFHSYNGGFSCFELLGFDVMLDDAYKPWLIEVNHSPSFNVDSPLDYTLKREMLADVFRLVSTKASEKRKFVRNQRKESEARLAGKKFSIPMHQRTDIASTLAVEQNREEALDERLEWEEKHMGGFRRMYPHKSRANYREQFLPNQPGLG